MTTRSGAGKTPKLDQARVHLQLQSPEEPRRTESMIRQSSDDDEHVINHHSATRPKAESEEGNREDKNEELMSLLACLNE